MKTDNYLALCVEQAALSPLHYRHGCIIVRGGKVIGQGFNDYRPGYDGGALKHGRIASAALDGPAIAELKRKRKFKPKSNLKSMGFKNAFIRFEGMGSGHHANVPLSMHSEMMAIHSALARSGTMTASAVSYEKPCFKLSGGGKRKARLRNGVLKAYVERAFAAAEKGERRSGNAQKDEWRFETGASQPDQAQRGPFGRGVGGVRGRGVTHAEKYGERLYDEEESVSPTTPVSAPKSSLRSGPQTENIGNRQALGEIRTKELSKHQSEADKPVKLSTTHRPKKSPEKPSDGAQATPLIPVGRVSHRNRVKHRRLNGSDLYVVRLGRPDNAKSTRCSSSLLLSPITEPTPPDAVTEDTASEISDSSRTSSTSTGSLHDELLNPHPKPSPPISPAAQVDATFLDVSAIRSSRPCYRCIEAMHSAGVKRVFWTEEGSSEWRGAKVRDLVAVLDGTRGSDGSSGVEQMFVTKHELLMLRRCMVGGKE